MATAQNKIIHRFIRPIADYEQGGTYYKRIIPVDTQAYAYYTKTEENEKEGLFYVFGDGVHTYIELREGKGRTESSKEWPVVSQEDISGKIDTLIAGANVVITGEGAERTISVPNMPIANKFLSSADLEKVEMGELLEKQYISLIKPLLNDVEIQVNDIVIYNTNEQLLVTEVDLESQTFGGVIIYVPYKDFKISFEQVEGNLLDNTSAKETLDTKLDKQSIPNKLYGIDAESNQFLYNVTEVGIEEAPQDEKEYVRNNGAWVEIDHSKVLDDATPSPITTYSSLKIDTELSNLKEAIGSLNSFEIQVVDTLPEIGDDRCIYLVPVDQEEEKDVYDEYIYINNKWELLGSTEIDLSGYATKEELDKKIQDEVAIRVQEDALLQEKIDTLQANDEKLEIEINKKQNTLVAGQHISIDSTSNTISAEGFVESVNGLTGIVTIDKTTVGLDKVDNTSDLEKPISNATQTAISAETNRAIKEESRLAQLITTNSEDIKTKADKTTLACQGWVNSKLQFYSSVENVTSSINTAIDNLTQQVENTYLTKTDASTIYATKSEIPTIDTSNFVTINTIQNITGNKTFDSSTTFFKGNYDYIAGTDYSDGYKDVEFKHISLQDINGVESGFISHHLQTPYHMFEIGVEHNDIRSSIMQAITEDNQSAIWVNADRFMVMGGGTGFADVATQGFVENATTKAPQTLYQNITKPSIISSKCTIDLADNCTMYSLETDITRQATVEFNNSPIYSHINPLENNYYSTIRPITFEIYRPAYNVEDNTIWPSTITWLSGSAPKLESGYAGLYAFRSFNGGASWIGNLQYTWQDTIPVITFRFILDSSIFNQAQVDNWIWYYENSDTQKLILNAVNKYPIVYANYKVKLSGTEISFPITSGSSVNYNFVIYGKNKVTGEIKQFNPSPASGGIQSFTASETITITLS